jgi:hypothetical protein
MQSEARRSTKRYGEVAAVEEATFSLPPAAREDAYVELSGGEAS